MMDCLQILGIVSVSCEEAPAGRYSTSATHQIRVVENNRRIH